jgi:hypothetical protein
MNMKPEQIRAARSRLGELWGKRRPLYASELARALRLAGNDPGKSILDMERGNANISGPVSALLELYLSGVDPPDGIPQGGIGSGIKAPDYNARRLIK